MSGSYSKLHNGSRFVFFRFFPGIWNYKTERLRELPVDTKAGVLRDRTVGLTPFGGHCPLEESDNNMDSSLQKSTYAYVNIHKIKVKSTSCREGGWGRWQVRAIESHIYERTETHQSSGSCSMKGGEGTNGEEGNRSPETAPQFQAQQCLSQDSSEIPACLLTSLDITTLA